MNYKLIYDDFHNNNYMQEWEDGSYVHILEHIHKQNLKYENVLDIGCSIGNGLIMFQNLQKKANLKQNLPLLLVIKITSKK